ncbi:unnamed protein product [Citrullus colocynthis]|uniref:Uncharacterized protein n=1 Tax=Citrullus colocynthis TaxID=252529 RepID=A0ABP0Y9U1_9ROSI
MEYGNTAMGHHPQLDELGYLEGQAEWDWNHIIDTISHGKNHEEILSFHLQEAWRGKQHIQSQCLKLLGWNISSGSLWRTLGSNPLPKISTSIVGRKWEANRGSTLNSTAATDFDPPPDNAIRLKAFAATLTEDAHHFCLISWNGNLVPKSMPNCQQILRFLKQITMAAI